MPFTVYLTLPPERFGFVEIPPPPAQPSPPSASLYPTGIGKEPHSKEQGYFNKSQTKVLTQIQRPHALECQPTDATLSMQREWPRRGGIPHCGR